MASLPSLRTALLVDHSSNPISRCVVSRINLHRTQQWYHPTQKLQSRRFATTCNFRRRNLLFLSPTLLPEPNSSAAGVRTDCLIRHFLSSIGSKSSMFDRVHYASGNPAAKDTAHCENDDVRDSIENLREAGMELHSIRPNRTEDVEEWLQKNEDDDNQGNHLTAVVFDRFFAEEAYSFHFRRMSPNALRILDMQDMHSLRATRQQLVLDWDKIKNNTTMMTPDLMREIVECKPSVHLDNHKEPKITNLLLRELAAVHRSDLVLVCSPHELRLLRDEYGVASHKLVLAPFFTSSLLHNNNAQDKMNSDPRHVVFLGGFRHAPNVDAVLYLYREVWPALRAALCRPDVELHVYGAYHQHLQKYGIPRSKDGFVLKGFAKSLRTAFRDAHVMLCPLRYGAGIKGKIVDAWRHSVPVVTTDVGAEGMTPFDVGDDAGMLTANDTASLVSAVVELYKDGASDARRKYVDNGHALLKELYDPTRNLNRLDSAVKNALSDLPERRKCDYTASLLWHQNARSTEYFSKWIELKEKTAK